MSEPNEFGHLKKCLVNQLNEFGQSYACPIINQLGWCIRISGLSHLTCSNIFYDLTL